MRITCLIDSLVGGGAQRQLCTLAVLFKRQGHSVSVLTYQPNDFFLSTLQEAGVEYRCIQQTSKLRRIIALRNELRGGSQEVVLAFLDGGCLYAELAALPWRNWGLVVSERLAVPNSHKAKLQWRRSLHRAADYITTNSHTNRLIIERAVPGLAGRVVTIYNALDLDTFSPGKGATSNTRIQLVVAARYHQQKNLVGLVDAIAIARSKAPQLEVSVDWYGYDPYKGQMLPEPTPMQAGMEQIRQHYLEDRFCLHEDSKDIVEIYRNADAVILPSFFEGLPNIVCEAMGCGRPVLMSNVCDAGNLVQEGQNGFLFDPSSPEDIARAIVQFGGLDRSEREALGAKGRLMAEEMFQPLQVAEKYLELLEAAASGQRMAVRHWLPSVPATAYQSVS